MRMQQTSRWLALFAVLTATACDDLGTTSPIDEALTPEDEIALQVLENPVAIQTALELAGTSASPSPWHGIWPGTPRGESSYAQQARTHFELALDALHSGDRMRAAQESRQARLMVSQGIVAVRGPGAVTAMVERMEDLSLTATTMGANHEDAELLSQQMGMLSGWARHAMEQGDMTGAGALGVLGEQRFSQSVAGGFGWGMADSTGVGVGHGNGNSWGRGMGSGHGMGGGRGHGTGSGTGQHGAWGWDAELVVALGGEAVDLASRILADTGADLEQEEYLAAAVEAQAEAEAALAEGNAARASYLAQLAQWQALKAVVLPGGVTAEEAEAMLALAETLYAQAEEAVGAEPTELQAELLAHADALIRLGESHMGTWRSMGVSPLWRAAVISSWLLG